MTLNSHFDQAITQIHLLCNLPSPTNLPLTIKFRMDARKHHRTKHHGYICPDIDLPLMYEAVQKHPKWSAVEKVHKWALALTTFCLGKRCSEQATYCPDVAGVCVCVCVCVCMYVRTYIHTYIHTYIRTYIHTHIHACMHTYIHQIFMSPRRLPIGSPRTFLTGAR